MKWATRTDMHVDRTACAWLIRRFIDPVATFVFVADPADVPADATAFDIPGARFSHHDGGCTFEVLVREYRLAEPGLEALARIVHEADIGDERFSAPEAPGLDAVVRGLGLIADDTSLLEMTAPIFDGLLRFEAARGVPS
jgi:hypothetical protein